MLENSSNAPYVPLLAQDFWRPGSEKSSFRSSKRYGGFPSHGGTPNSSISKGFSNINQTIWGYPHDSGNHHINSHVEVLRTLLSCFFFKIYDASSMDWVKGALTASGCFVMATKNARLQAISQRIDVKCESNVWFCVDPCSSYTPGNQDWTPKNGMEDVQLELSKNGGPVFIQNQTRKKTETYGGKGTPYLKKHPW